MNTEIGKAYVQIVPSAKGIEGSIQKVLNGESVDAGKKSGGLISSHIKGAITAAGIGAVLTKSIKEGAQYEQAVGGIETLFKSYSGEMVKYANDAWKTAGISANAYMEQSTSFAASLLQSVKGDVQLAGEAANQAVIDMADNANKMGTPLENIQNAYQGFAKQNYTMLDNLKLGYGGTKTEMERLLADAEKFSGVHYDINNLNDVYSAIHVIQGELGITGTTAKEAEKTLSGSFTSMGSAFSNFMAQLSTGGDVEKALGDLTDSAVTFFIGNLIPAGGKIVAALPGIIIQTMGTTLPKIITTLTDEATDLLEGTTPGTVEKYVASFLPKLVAGGVKLTGALLKSFITLGPALIKAAASSGKGFIDGMWNVVTNGVGKLIAKVKAAFKFNVSLPKIALPHFSIVPSGWKLGDLLKGSIPKLSISWHQDGKILDKPTLLHGAGENGAEAIIPLDKKPKMKPFAEAIAEYSGGRSNVYNIGDVRLDVSDLKDIATIEKLAQLFKRAKAFV